MRISFPAFSIIVSPANPCCPKPHHVNIEHSICNWVYPSVGIICEKCLRCICRIFPSNAPIARSHRFFKSNEENTSARGNAQTRLCTLLPYITEVKLHFQWCYICIIASCVCDKETVRKSCFYDNRRII